MSKKRIALYIIGLLVLAVGGFAAWMLGPALFPPKPVDVGIAVNTAAPVEMELVSSDAEPTTLAANMGEKGMLLYLVRSADWCPFCKGQLVTTKEIQKDVIARGYSLVSLSYDKPEVLAQFIAAESIGYTMLSDPGSAMIDALGLRDPQYGEGSFAQGVPRASILLLAPDGTVKAKYVAADYRSRPSNEDVLAMLDSAGS